MKRGLWLLAAMMVVCSTSGFAQAGYMKVYSGGGITGGSIDTEHKNWSDLLTMNWGMNSTYSQSSGSTGVTSYDGVSVTMKMDRACTKFYEIQAASDMCDSVIIELEDISQKTSATYRFNRIKLVGAFFVEHLTSWDPTAGAIETYTFKYRRILVEYFIVNNKGVVTKTGEFSKIIFAPFDDGDGGLR